jgi:DNA-binding IclR family transcriptional regulator
MTTGTAVREKRFYNLNCITNGLTLLNLLFDAEESMSLVELCLAAKLSKNKAFRLLNNFEHSGIIEKDLHGKYCLGTPAFVTAKKIVSKGISAEHVRSMLEKLAAQFNEAVYFARSACGQATLTDMVDCTHKVRARSFVGSVLHGQEGERKDPVAMNLKLVNGVTIYSGVIDPEITTVSIDIANNCGMVIGSLVVLAPSFRMPLERIASEIIPLLHETIRSMPQISASDRGKPAPAVLQLVPKREELYGRSRGSATV